MSSSSVAPDPTEQVATPDPAVVNLEGLHEVEVRFDPEAVIAAQPITAVRPPDDVAVTERVSKRPTWLPADWTMEHATRKNGATAGRTDPYYRDPSGRKFRSKPEVLYFLETGKKLKKESKPRVTTEASGGPTGQRKRKSSAESTKPEA